MPFNKLLDAKDYEIISQLRLMTKRRMHGLVTGEQRSPNQGGGIEFADYREYQPGDDIRQIDWPVFLRLRRLLVKLCAEEKELTLMLLLDHSQSMSYGTRDKLRQAVRVAAIFAGIALQSGNRVGIFSLGDRTGELVPPFRNQMSLFGVIEALSRIEPVREPLMAESAKHFVTRYGRKCVWVLLSDLLFPEWPQVINHLGAGGAEGYILQILAPEERHPAFWGEVTLVDSENGTEVPLHIGQAIAKQYQTELAQYLAEVRELSRHWGMQHFLIESDAALDRIFHHELRKGGLIC